MKVLHLIAGAPHGGAETFFVDTVRALAKRGVEQHVLCRPHPLFQEPLKQALIPYETLSFNRLKKWLEQRKIAEVIARTRPDVVHAWMARAASFLPPFHLVGTPAIGWFGGYYDLKHYKNCAAYIGITRDMVRYIGEASGAPMKTFLVHTFGTLTPLTIPLTRSMFDIPEGSPIVLILSRMHWQKGIDILLHAVQNLHDVYVLLAGDGPDMIKYKALARTLGVESRVRFLGWRTDRAALLDLADVCTLPSRQDSFGTVMAEAWGAGVPLVAARADGPRQYVKDGENGLLCDINDSQGLENAIRAVLRDSDLRTRLIAGGKASYEAFFCEEVVIQSLIKVYEAVRG